jgi:hypothetical protein
MTLLLLSGGTSEATFDIEDPSKIVEEDINKATEALEAAQESAAAEEKVIVPTGTELYTPGIAGGVCNGWSIDESESGMNDTGSTYSTTRTTYTGVTIKTITCNNEADGGSLQLALVRVGRDRLIWVESNRILTAD